jgi:molybdenum cofactor sulfurtransferase
MEVDQWEMNIDTGNLLYDREFALVDVSGTALRLCRYPKMGSIRPHIDPEKKTLSVSAPSCPTLVINLDADLHHPMTDIKVCGNKCDGKLWGSYAVSSWFSDYLGVRCWLARANTNAQNQILKHVDVETRLLPKARVGFENEAPLLLLSTNSVDILNNQLRLRGSCEVNAKFFRPNLVVEIEKTCGNTNPEDRWATVTIPRSVTELEVTGQCARCSMVDVDPDSGMKGKTLSALAEYRRNNGQITFGIFLKIKNKYHDNGDSSIWIKKGDILEAKRLC